MLFFITNCKYPGSLLSFSLLKICFFLCLLTFQLDQQRNFVWTPYTKSRTLSVHRFEEAKKKITFSSIIIHKTNTVQHLKIHCKWKSHQHTKLYMKMYILCSHHFFDLFLTWPIITWIINFDFLHYEISIKHWKSIHVTSLLYLRFRVSSYAFHKCVLRLLRMMATIRGL